MAGHSSNGEALLAAKKYVEAAVAFEAGLAVDPTDTVCQQGLQRVKVKSKFLYRYSFIVHISI